MTLDAVVMGVFVAYAAMFGFDKLRQTLEQLDLLACPEDKVEVRPGPGGGPHLITVTTAAAVNGLSGDGGGWYLGSREYIAGFATEEEQAREARQVEEEFFPRMDRFLELVRAAYNAVTQWPM